MIDQGLGSENALGGTDVAEYVEVLYAKSMAEASRLSDFLERHSIAALVESTGGMPSQCGVAVLVPSDQLVEATEILTMQSDEDEDDLDDIDDDEDYDEFDEDEDEEFEDDEDLDYDDDDDDDYDDDDDLYEDDDDI